MQLITYFFSNNLLIKSLLLSNKFVSFNNKIEHPIKYYSIKTIKKYYYENNVYFDLYNDLCNSITCFADECELYNNNNKNNNNNNNNNKINVHYSKYNDLTAEHIFPQSFMKYYAKANKDMHNIYLTNYYTNNHRSNYKFSNWTQKNNIYVPCNYSRGMISRSLVYMKYTYPLLNLSYVIDYENLIMWNKKYPPNDYELMKNKLINKYQGNSNIFIEDYELLELFIKNIIVNNN